jgi:hypothetical protein
LTNDKCFSHLAYGNSNRSLDYIVHGSSSFYEFYYNNKPYKSGYIHQVSLRNLKPQSLYYYRCGDFMVQEISDILTFTTLPEVDDNYNTKFNFGIFA